MGDFVAFENSPGRILAAQAGTPNVRQLLRALDAVIDPELDEPITTLRFISDATVTPDGDVSVRLRLPTPQCAPNFAFLMAADARRAVLGVPGVREVTVTLEDHYTGEEINAAINRGAGFTGAFPGETDDDGLESLRELFFRKALVARQAKVCQQLLAAGEQFEQLTARRVRDLPDVPDARRSLVLRAQLGIPAGPDAAAFVTADGTPLHADQMPRWLRMARLIATSLEANGGICRSLLAIRHNLKLENEEVAR